MSELTTLESVQTEINGTLAFLDTEFSLDEAKRRNVVLFVGLTGSGKSTLCQFLAGNPNLTIAQNGGDFYITDGNDKVSDDTTISKTVLPELVPIPDTNTVLADCPGFSDTRSTRHDIASAVFTKKLLDESEKVKIMVVVSHHSVRKGVDRIGFIHLLAHMAHFIKDVEKYKDSIGLLVTKVENLYTEDDDGNNILIPDFITINEIGSFLVSTKIELMTQPQSNFIIKQTQFIDIFIAKNDKNEFSKIGIFRRPSKIGNLNLNKRLTTNREAIKSIMNNAIQTSQVAPNDFGLSLSANSKIMVSKMRETLNINLYKILDDYIRVYSQQPLDISTTNIESMKTVITRFINIIDLLEASINPNMVVRQLMEGIYKLDPEHPAQQYYADWKKQQKYLQLLESISPIDKDVNDFNKYHTKIVDFKGRLADNIKLMEHNVEATIDQAISEVINQAMIAVRNETVNLGLSSNLLYSELSGNINGLYNSLDQFKTTYPKNVNLSFKEFIDSLSGTLKISKKQAEKLAAIQADIEFFKSKLSAAFTDGHQNIWLQGFTVPLNDIREVAIWYSFISDSYAVMIDYDNVIAITNKMKFLKNWEDFKLVRKELDRNKALDKYLEARPTLSGKEQTDLDNLIDAVQQSPVHTCQSSKLIVKGNLVKLSDVKTNFIPKCPTFVELYIFATQTLFIDDSLIEPTKNVYIVAPTWHIDGYRLISLRGPSGKLEDFALAGGPGQPGGNFVGIGDNFINGNALTIDVSGGNGGNGKDGDNGKNGFDGLTPNVPKTSIWHSIFSVDNCETRIHDELIKGGGNFGYFNEGSDTFKLFGTNATQGSDGGNGGEPGFGGKPGEIVVNSSKINQLANTGNDGVPGMGGKGGKGGEHGQTRHVKCQTERKVLEWKIKFTYENILLKHNGRAVNGYDGISAVEGVPLAAEDPKPFETQFTVATQYKQYAQQKKSRFVDSVGFINRHLPNKRKRFAPTLPISDDINWIPQPLTIDGKTSNVGNRFWNSEFSPTSFMALADVLIRKLMKTKPANVESRVRSNWENLLVQAEVLKIVEKCEAKWNELNRDKVGQKPFDPLCLQKELYSRLKQQGVKTQVQQIESEVFEKLFA